MRRTLTRYRWEKYYQRQSYALRGAGAGEYLCAVCLHGCEAGNGVHCDCGRRVCMARCGYKLTETCIACEEEAQGGP